MEALGRAMCRGNKGRGQNIIWSQVEAEGIARLSRGWEEGWRSGIDPYPHLQLLPTATAWRVGLELI
jgi:hypothetical protein